MQDPRIRIAGTTLLSVASFISLTGAILTCLWWALCTNRKTAFPDLKSIVLVFMLPTVAALATTLSGGDGLSYFVRISSILLIASWAYSERYPGELLDVLSWLFGCRLGFDLGLIAELSLSSAEVLADEIRRTRIALEQKDQGFSLRSLAPVVTSLLIRQLSLARERAGILALRGYRGGGSLYPSFQTSSPDIIAGVFCMLIFMVSLLPGVFLWSPAKYLLF